MKQDHFLKQISGEIADLENQLDCNEDRITALYCKYLSNNGFVVKDEEYTAQAAYQSMEGGPSIGFFLSRGLDESLQRQIHIAAALALKKELGQSLPFRILLDFAPGGQEHKKFDVVFAVNSEYQIIGGCPPSVICSYAAEYRGKQAHAAAHPWDGRSAFDGLQLAFQGISVLRGDLLPSEKISFFLTDTGGTPANVVSDFSAASFYLQAANCADSAAIQNEIREILDAATLMTQTEVTYHKDFECEAVTAFQKADGVAPLCLILPTKNPNDFNCEKSSERFEQAISAGAEALFQIGCKLLKSPELLEFLSTTSYREEDPFRSLLLSPYNR